MNVAPAATPSVHAHAQVVAPAMGGGVVIVDAAGRNPSIHSSRNSSPVGKIVRVQQPQPQPQPSATSPRKKRKSLDDASAPLEPHVLNHNQQNARELLLGRIALQTGLPRGCLQLESLHDPMDGTAGPSRPRLRVHIKCNAMLQPSSEWAYNQSWLRRQVELAGDEVAEAAVGSASTESRASAMRSCFRDSAKARHDARLVRTIRFDESPPQVMETLPDERPSERPANAVAAAFAAAAAGESDPSVGFAKSVSL